MPSPRRSGFSFRAQRARRASSKACLRPNNPTPPLPLVSFHFCLVS